MIAAWALAAAVSSHALPAAGPASVERRLTLMGTQLTVEVEAVSRPAALAASERAVAALEATEARLSTWRPDSELSRLNRAPAGEPFPLSPELAADLAAAERCYRLTGGAFDPTVGALAAAWGLRIGGRQPSPQERVLAMAATGMSGLEVSGGVAVRRRPGLTLDEGGFGKGVGLAAALGVLQGGPGVEKAFLDLGGQVAMLGEGAVWEVPVADPRDRRRPVVVLALDGGSLATSGNSERGIRAGGESRSHILDPRSGSPAPDLGSLTVWAPDPILADCLSTGLYVMGAEEALAWAMERPDVEVLVISPRGDRLVARATPGLADRIRSQVDDLEVSLMAPARSEWDLARLRGDGRRTAASSSQP